MRTTLWIGLVCLLLSSCASSEPTETKPTNGKAAAVNDANFEQEVLLSKEPVLVDFWAPWCPPCVAIGPHVDGLAGDLKGKVKVVKLNVDDAKATAAKYHVQGIPTFILFKNGEIAMRSEGAPGGNKSALAAWVNGALK